MKTKPFAVETIHPIHTSLIEFHLLTKNWLAGIGSSEISRMRRATARAVGAVEVASAGFRRAHHLRLAQESLRWMRSGFGLLFLEKVISPEVFDEARRRLDQI